MLPNILFSLISGAVPALINLASGQASPESVAAAKRSAGSGVIITPTSANTGIAGVIASTAIMILGAAGLGDFTHSVMFVLGAIGTVATTVSHLHLIGASNDNTLEVIGALLQQIAQAGGVPPEGSEVLLTGEPSASPSPSPSSASPIGAIS
jgi:hypothetical protein